MTNEATRRSLTSRGTTRMLNPSRRRTLEGSGATVDISYAHATL
jgi:hypothetical protein